MNREETTAKHAEVEMVMRRRKENRSMSLSKLSTSRRSKSSYHREHHERRFISRKKSKEKEKFSIGSREGSNRGKGLSRSLTSISSTRREASELRSKGRSNPRRIEVIN